MQTEQLALLMDILRKNRTSCYGEKHSFSQINNYAEFITRIPINTFADLAPYVEQIKNGESNIMTSDPIIRFNITSGTTDKPKYIPITKSGLSQTETALQQWISSALRDHPSLLDHAFVCISGASIEGKTESGIPYGCASGLMYKLLPQKIHNLFTLPFYLSKIENYDLRYYLMARLAIEHETSFLVTPNPSTLIRFAETAITYQKEIIHSIRNGALFHKVPFELNENDSQIVKTISANLQPNNNRADFLEAIIKKYGKLLPSSYWKKLKLIGCWLGGSCGFQIDKLTKYFGSNISFRDIGYLASEGTMTIPTEDNTSAGVIALQNNFYEFIPLNHSSSTRADPLLCHQLKKGKQYKILLTNCNGLYRYDINDIIEVCGYKNQMPLIAFIRKGGEMLNITGEKLHANHLAIAMHRLAKESGISVAHFKAVPNYTEMCYEILVQISGQELQKDLQDKILPCLDKYLSKANLEYAAKRKSKRLNEPRLHLMDSSWADALRKHYVATRGHDIQYKWQTMTTEISELDKKHMLVNQ